MPLSRHHTLLLALVAVLVVSIGALSWRALHTPSGDPAELLEAGIVLLPQPREVAPVNGFTDQNGTAASTAGLKDRWTLLFFGYTFCPDICPTTLADLHKVLGKLPLQVRQQLRIVFVSVDPGRDTPERLKQYLAFFDPSFEGLTGSADGVAQLASEVSIPYIAPDTREPGYTVSHSGNLAVIGPDGRQRGFVRAPLNVDKLAGRLPQLMD